jgi:hypothetical protein
MASIYIMEENNEIYEIIYYKNTSKFMIKIMEFE